MEKVEKVEKKMLSNFILTLTDSTEENNIVCFRTDCYGGTGRQLKHNNSVKSFFLLFSPVPVDKLSWIKRIKTGNDEAVPFPFSYLVHKVEES